jgi:hypothetical protein
MQQIPSWMLRVMSPSTALKIMEPSYHSPRLYAQRGYEIMANAREQATRSEMEIESAYRRRRG